MSMRRPERPFCVPSPVGLTVLQDEVRQITRFTPSKALYDAGRDDHAAFALRGYSRDPFEIESPVSRAIRADTAQRVPSPAEIMDTDAAGDFPHCLAVADAIPGPSERVRVVRLGPFQMIPKHRDPHPAWADRWWVRFHVAIDYPDECVFAVWDRTGQIHEICRPPGSVWYLDTNWPHMVMNGSVTEARLTLTIDKFLDDALRAWLAEHGA